MWVQAHLHKPDGRRYDLLVRFGKRWRRVPNCYWNRGAKAWRCRSQHAHWPHDNLLKGASEIGYFMPEPEFPHHLDHHRRK